MAHGPIIHLQLQHTLVPRPYCRRARHVNGAARRVLVERAYSQVEEGATAGAEIEATTAARTQWAAAAKWGEMIDIEGGREIETPAVVNGWAQVEGFPVELQISKTYHTWWFHPCQMVLLKRVTDVEASYMIWHKPAHLSSQNKHITWSKCMPRFLIYTQHPNACSPFENMASFEWVF